MLPPKFWSNTYTIVSHEFKDLGQPDLPDRNCAAPDNFPKETSRKVKAMVILSHSFAGRNRSCVGKLDEAKLVVGPLGRARGDPARDEGKNETIPG
jgi:hypothetical protein